MAKVKVTMHNIDINGKLCDHTETFDENDYIIKQMEATILKDISALYDQGSLPYYIQSFDTTITDYMVN